MTAAAQQPPERGTRLTRDEAVRLAIENNPASRPADSIPRSARSASPRRGAPSCRICRRRCCETASRARRSNLFSGDGGRYRLLVRIGGGQPAAAMGRRHSYDVSFDSARTTTTNPLTTFTPSLTSSLQAVFSQPLLRNFQTDPVRAQIELAERTERLRTLRLQEHDRAARPPRRKRAYWNLVVGACARSACSSARSTSRSSSSEPTVPASTSASRRRSISSPPGRKSRSGART